MRIPPASDQRGILVARENRRAGGREVYRHAEQRTPHAFCDAFRAPKLRIGTATVVLGGEQLGQPEARETFQPWNSQLDRDRDRQLRFRPAAAASPSSAASQHFR